MLENDLSKYELSITEDATSIIDSPTQCFACGKPVSQDSWNFSVTAYPSQNQRKDYWTRLHLDCRLPDWAQNGQPLG